MLLSVLLRRASGLVLRPDTEWQAVAREPGGVGAALVHLLVFAAVGPVMLALGRALVVADALPVVGLSPLVPGSPMDSAIGSFVFPTIPWLTLPARNPGLVQSVLDGLSFYAQTLSCIAVGAVALTILAPWCGGQRALGASLRVCAYGATPLLVSEVGLLLPSLLPLLMVGCVHSCYVVHGGICRLLGLPSSEAAMLLGLAALVLLGALPLLGALLALIAISA